jgi:hypothetical protein
MDAILRSEKNAIPELPTGRENERCQFHIGNVFLRGKEIE